MTPPIARDPDRLRTALDQLSGLAYTKGHGTGNDFVLVPDLDGETELSPDHVEALCDRHLGVGADGLIRVVGSTHLIEGRDLLAEHPEATWFMDYRNADGSVAEMCGNGVRVFVHYLATRGLVDLAPGQTLTIGTRAGARAVTRLEDGYSTDMGPWDYLDPELAKERASDSLVLAAGLEDPRPALSLSLGNPHTVVALPDEGDLQWLDLTKEPNVDPVPPNGTNVEFVVPADPLFHEGVGRVQMRVHERGVGETQSCGTGACAAATAVRLWAGDRDALQWRVGVPGGTVGVEFLPQPDGSERVLLSGPAALVFDGTMA
ncbi:diaminopimelate epimerase [Citricoccus nitrophenolicus]|uniref:Diaminopimelate epimerase n=1 Tax=Citricoccus nitrophenolicus TaxID=863575 RepID=A0ABV0IEW5_9MICC|nr:diaminopimelate epimerase [Citricoccus sp. I39-566]WMY76905.1 diaminopimelate epimerase [Citricoccus sp. I39-566]